ncbi:MAG TPA: protein kinase, partial [Vicinamibacteria bacterium]|nr:protein kinase [Vicinamibacteria bacterium]
LTSAPTRARDLTTQGTILGTVPYMAPEQLEGKEADARTDVFAFGVVLHEMATGKKAFNGASRASLIASILSSEPPAISSVQPMSPPALDHLVKTCLAKDPEDRWQTAHDAMAELRWISDMASQTSGTAPAILERRRRARLAWAAATLLAAITAGLAGWWIGAGASPPRSPLYLALAFSPETPLVPGNRLAFALSPDGRRLVYAGRQGSRSQLFVRSFDEPDSKPLGGGEMTERVQEGNPFFSPDGAWVAFFADGKLKKAPVAGGPPVVLCAAPSGRGGSWGDDGTIVFAPSLSSGLSRIPAGGGTPEVLTQPEAAKGENSHRWPDVLPGSQAVLFTIGTGSSWANAHVVVQSLKTGERRKITDGAFPRYVPTGHVLFARGPAILALPFDARTLTPTGPAVPVLDSVESAYSTGAGAAQLAVSSTGTLAYVASGAAERTLVWADRKGQIQEIAAPAHPYTEVALAPSGDRAVLTVENGPDLDLWSYDFERGTLIRLSFGGTNESPVWSPDGRRIAYSASAAGAPQAILWMPADGSGAAEELVKGELGWRTPISFAPDGKLLTVDITSPGTDYDIWALPLEGERKLQPLVRTRYWERQARFSPDGRHFIYQSAEAGRLQVYIQPYPGPAGKRQVSTDGGFDARWSRTGREIFYKAGDRAEKMMAVDIETSPELRVGKPRLLFETRQELGLGGTDFDITPDGQRFIFIKAGPRESQQAHLELVLNWFDELRRRVPAGKR